MQLSFFKLISNSELSNEWVGTISGGGPVGKGRK